jgi:hypothetical protein
VCHRLQDAIEHPPRALQRLRIRLVRLPAALVLEGQPLAFGCGDLLPHPGKRSLVILSVFPGINHRRISVGLPAQSTG